jgi:hypothetical protein
MGGVVVLAPPEPVGDYRFFPPFFLPVVFFAISPPACWLLSEKAGTEVSLGVA